MNLYKKLALLILKKKNSIQNFLEKTIEKKVKIGEPLNLIFHQKILVLMIFKMMMSCNTFPKKECRKF
jgi:hypothetical protein